MGRNAERCVSCGATIPEGRMVCPGCEEAARAKAKIEALQMDKEQLQSDIINANQNFNHIKELWEKEKEKVAFAKQKLIKACRDLQTAKAEIERLQKALEVVEVMEDQHKYYLQKAKAEAYKEFAERLKIRFSGTLQCSGWIIQKVAEDILEELVGDTDV